MQTRVEADISILSTTDGVSEVACKGDKITLCDFPVHYPQWTIGLFKMERDRWSLGPRRSPLLACSRLGRGVPPAVEPDIGCKEGIGWLGQYGIWSKTHWEVRVEVKLVVSDIV